MVGSHDILPGQEGEGSGPWQGKGPSIEDGFSKLRSSATEKTFLS